MVDACRSPGLIQRYREELQVRHYARRTVNIYEQWLRASYGFTAGSTRARWAVRR